MEAQGKWEYNREYKCWELRKDRAELCLAPRPSYCDRGHWVATVSGISTIDEGDAFPRYYMDIERAKAELSDWLEWRLKREAGGY